MEHHRSAVGSKEHLSDVDIKGPDVKVTAGETSDGALVLDVV